MREESCFGLGVASRQPGANAMDIKGKNKRCKGPVKRLSVHTVVVKEEPSKGAVTGLDGSFSLSVNRPTFTIICTYIGYKSYEMQVTSKDSDIEIPLASDDVLLGEVTVVATNPGRSEAGARAIERKAMNVVNVMSAKAIELSPDITGRECNPAYVGCDD